MGRYQVDYRRITVKTSNAKFKYNLPIEIYSTRSNRNIIEC